MQGTFLYQNGSNRSFSFVKLCLDHQTSCLTFRVGFQFQNVCGQQYHLQKVFNTLSGFCGYRNTDGASAPVLGDEAVLGQLLFYTVNACPRFIDLVDGNDDFHACCLRMVDGLYRLRFYTIICSNYQNCDIGGICSTHTHGGKCLMSRSIQESDLTVFDGYGVSADVLGNTTCLAVSYVSMTDGIQKGCFTMVYMTHNTYNRRSLYKSIFRIFHILQKFSDHILFYFRFRIKVIFQSNLTCCLEIQLRVYSQHLAFQEQLLNDG